MIKHIDISATHRDEIIDKDLAKYIQKKIGKLDRHLKKTQRSEARADVKLKESTGKGSKKCTAEVILHIPGDILTATESTMNMYAAIDIVENKLQNQLKKHKEKNSPTKNKQKGRARAKISSIFSRKEA